MDVQLPKKCFISHSYADAEARDRIIANLPPEVEPHVFPQITVSPNEFVSNELIQSIIDCDGFIYLQGGASDRSFWVAFERDYALRAGKKVFKADIATLKLFQHIGNPLDLAVYPSYQNGDEPKVKTIVDFLKQKRHFDLLLHEDFNYPKTIDKSIEVQLARGGYVVVFFSHSTTDFDWRIFEIGYTSAHRKFNDRVLIAYLEDVKLPHIVGKKLIEVQLFEDAERGQSQRLDDLIVRLYWLIYRNTEHGKLE